MLQTLKTLLDDPKERSMNLGIEINQDAEAKTTEEDLPAEAEIGRNDSNGEELHVSHVSALVYEADSGRNGSNGEYIGPTRLSLWIVSLFKMKRNKTK
jgi:hypothetical protein